MEWDTAAGHAIINGVGKDMYDTQTQSYLNYRELESFTNVNSE